jgi:hypothetical protein
MDAINSSSDMPMETASAESSERRLLRPRSRIAILKSWVMFAFIRHPQISQIAQIFNL